MSAEGDENLDNNAAGDLISVTSELLFNRVLLLMRHPNGHEYDDQEIGELFFVIEMIFALHANEMLGSAESTANIPNEVEPYIARWEEYHRSAGHEPPEARAESMRATFDRLLSIIGGFSPREGLDSDPDDIEVIDGMFRYSDSQGNPR